MARYGRLAEMERHMKQVADRCKRIEELYCVLNDAFLKHAHGDEKPEEDERYGDPD